MQADRPTLLILSGFDPSGGAGFTADIRTSEALQMHSIGCVTALTVQSVSSFESLEWVEEALLHKQLQLLMHDCPPDAVKVGMVKSAAVLTHLLELVHDAAPGVPVVWDPVLSPSAGGDFQKNNVEGWQDALAGITVFTPNQPEMQRLSPNQPPSQSAAFTARTSGAAVLLKGGHDALQPGLDRLYIGDTETVIPAIREDTRPKHGSGCVLSTAIAAYLAMGHSIEEACTKAKKYTEDFLASAPGLVGFHVLS